jgi:hypothetical protein
MSQQGGVYFQQGTGNLIVPNGKKVVFEVGSEAEGLAAVVEQAAVADLGGSLTGTTDGDLADIAAINLSTSDSYTDAAVNTAVNAVVTAANLQIKELQVKVNDLLAKLRLANIIAE